MVLGFSVALYVFFFCVCLFINSFTPLPIYHTTFKRIFDHTKNSFKLYDEKMRCISTKRKDLDDMLDRLNVQVDNPVCIMDQENSKEFIKGSEKDKYRYVQVSNMLYIQK
jgi:hypothetical protein